MANGRETSLIGLKKKTTRVVNAVHMGASIKANRSKVIAADSAESVRKES